MTSTKQGPVVDENGHPYLTDPTLLTDKAIAKAIIAERDYVDGQLAIRDERLGGIDEATKLRLTSISAIPGQIEASVGRLGDVVLEKFHSVENQFKERDTRSERESRDNKLAVDAAFAAQEKQAAAQNKSNAEAIGKSETSTSETINKLAELFQTTTNSLSDKIDDMKLRAVEESRNLRQSISEVGTIANGSDQRKVGNTESRSTLYATISVIVAIALVLIAFATLLLTRVPIPAK